MNYNNTFNIIDENDIIGNIYSELSVQALSIALRYHLTTKASIKKYIDSFEITNCKLDNTQIELLDIIKKYIPEFTLRIEQILKFSIIMPQKEISKTNSNGKNFHIITKPLINYQKTIDIETISNKLIENLSNESLSIINKMGYKNIFDYISIDIKNIKKSIKISKIVKNELQNLKNDSLEYFNILEKKEELYLPNLPRNSMLNAPISILFGLELAKCEYFSNTKLASLLSLSPEEWDFLNRINLFFEDDSADILFSNTINILLQRDLPLSIGNNIIINCLLFPGDHTIIFKYLNNMPFLNLSYINNLNIPLSYLIEFEKNKLSILNKYGYYTVDDLYKNSELKIYNEYEFSYEILDLIYAFWCCSKEIEEYYNNHRNEISSNENNIEQIFDDMFANNGFSQKEAIIFKARMNINNRYGNTLEEIGSYLKITRERVRQIEAKAEKKAFQIFKKEKAVFFNILVKYGNDNGIFSIFDISEFIKKSLNINSYGSEKVYGQIYSILFGYKYDKENNMIINPNYKCFGCEIIKKYIEEKVNNGNEYNIYELISEIKISCNMKKCNYKINNNAVLATIELMKNIDIYNDKVYSKADWAYPKGSLNQIIEEIVLNQERGAHYKKIYAFLKEKHPEYKDIEIRDLVERLKRNKNILLWDRGFYIHKRNIEINYNLLKKIENWIESELYDLPIILIRRVYNHFIAECKENGINSETALYSCLREINSSIIVLPKYPQIYLKESYIFRRTTNEIIEEFILNAGGPIQNASLREYCINKIGLKVFQYINFLKVSNEIIRFSEREYIHIENLDINKAYIEEIIDFIDSNIELHGHISVKRVFESKIVTCYKMGIRNAFLLYEVLKIESNEKYILRKYPDIAINNENLDQGLYILDKIALYIKEKRYYCTMSEIEDEFIDKLGYKENIVRRIVTYPKIYKYTNGSLIHEDTLGIESLLGKVEAAAIELLNMKSNIHDSITCLDEMLDLGLPRLKCNLPWTNTLLASILEKSDKVMFLGNAKQVISLKSGNKQNIFENIVKSIIKDQFGGAVDIHQLEKVLIEKKLILQSFNISTMLPSNSSISINGNTVFIID